MNLGDSDGGRPRGAVVAESFECVCALALHARSSVAPARRIYSERSASGRHLYTCHMVRLIARMPMRGDAGHRPAIALRGKNLL
jgi:hypothetical protein